MTPYYEDTDGITIYHGDCREILPTLPKVDLVLTDPPYGMAMRHGSRAQTPKQADGHLWGKQWGVIAGDDKPFDPTFLLRFPGAVIWGANHYSALLPSGNRWLVWHKGTPEGMSYSDCELAWTSIAGGGVWMKSVLWSGFRREVEVREHYHPTQKPISLMAFCLKQFPNAQTIFDPFMGSGTTLVAAKRLGRRAIGIEIEEKYCEIAAERLRREEKPLFATLAGPEQFTLGCTE